MIKDIPSNSLKSSILLFISVGLGLVPCLFNFSNISLSADGFLLVFKWLFPIAFIFIVAILIRKGYKWVKWLYLAWLVINLPGVIWTLPFILTVDIISGGIEISEIILQVTALILLLIAPKQLIRPK